MSVQEGRLRHRNFPAIFRNFPQFFRNFPAIFRNWIRPPKPHPPPPVWWKYKYGVHTEWPPWGAQPRLAQTRHQTVTPEQWQQDCEEHDQVAHRCGPDLGLPVQAWSESAMEILVRAVGPPAFSTGARVEAQEWGALMACKRRWQARAGYQEQKRVVLH